MKKNKKNYLMKRSSAYIIDLTLVSLIILLFSFFINTDLKKVNIKLDQMHEAVLKKEMNLDEYFGQFSEVMREKGKLEVTNTFLMMNAYILIFILVPYFKKKSIGMHVMKLKFKEDISIIKLILRSIITTGILVSIIGMALLFTKYYFILISIISLIQIILVIISLNMIIYRKDNSGLQDLISKSEVVEI